MYCKNCASHLSENAHICPNCGSRVNEYRSKSKLVALLLCIFVGTLGIHRFYVRDDTNGFIMLALTLGGAITCGITTLISGIWCVVDLILIILDRITDENGKPLEW